MADKLKKSPDICQNRVLKLIDFRPVYTVPDSRSHDIEFGQFAVIFILTTFSLINYC